MNYGWCTRAKKKIPKKKAMKVWEKHNRCGTEIFWVRTICIWILLTLLTLMEGTWLKCKRSWLEIRFRWSDLVTAGIMRSIASLKHIGGRLWLDFWLKLKIRKRNPRKKKWQPRQWSKRYGWSAGFGSGKSKTSGTMATRTNSKTCCNAQTTMNLN